MRVVHGCVVSECACVHVCEQTELGREDSECLLEVLSLRTSLIVMISSCDSSL